MKELLKTCYIRTIQIAAIVAVRTSVMKVFRRRAQSLRRIAR